MQHKRCGTGFAALAASALFITACSNATTDSQSSPSAASSDAAHNDADVTIDAGHDRLELLARAFAPADRDEVAGGGRELRGRGRRFRGRRHGFSRRPLSDELRRD